MKKNLSIKEAINVIVTSAKRYDEKLKNKQFLILYQENNCINSACVEFRDMNFLHLTGVKTNLSAQLFYSAAISGKLSEKDFVIDNTGKAQQKLSVLPHLSELLYNKCMVGAFLDNGIFIKADYFIGDTKAVISVGFRCGKRADIPVTLYKEDIKKLSKKTNKVLAVFVKHYNAPKFETCTFLVDGQQIEKLSFSSEVAEKIDINYIKRQFL